MLKHVSLGLLFLTLLLVSLINPSTSNIITGFSSSNESLQCGSCSNWTDIACGETELDTFGCSPEEMYQTRTCSIVVNPTGSPLIVKTKPLEIQPTGLAIFSSDETCSERCVTSNLCVTNNPPSQPIPITPEHKEVNIPLDYELNWYSEDPENDIITYDIFFGELDNLELVASNLNTTYYDLENLELNKIYKWKVIAKDNLSRVSSEIWWFKTENIPEEQSSNLPSGKSSFSNPSAVAVSEQEPTKNLEEDKIIQENLVSEEEPIKETFSNLLTGNAVNFVLSNNNVLFQLVSIILIISIIILFISKSKK